VSEERVVWFHPEEEPGQWFMTGGASDCVMLADEIDQEDLEKVLGVSLEGVKGVRATVKVEATYKHERAILGADGEE